MASHTRVPPKFKKAAQDNPWALTPMECYVVSLACLHGGAKFVWAQTGIPFRIAQDHIQSARARMGLRGHDCRVYIWFHEWFRQYDNPGHHSYERPQGHGQPPVAVDTHQYKPTTTWRKSAAD